MATQAAELYFHRFYTMTCEVKFKICLLTDLSEIKQLLKPIYSEIFAYTEASAWTPLTMLCNSGLEISYVSITFDEVLAAEACSGRCYWFVRLYVAQSPCAA